MTKLVAEQVCSVSLLVLLLPLLLLLLLFRVVAVVAVAAVAILLYVTEILLKRTTAEEAQMTTESSPVKSVLCFVHVCGCNINDTTAVNLNLLNEFSGNKRLREGMPAGVPV